MREDCFDGADETRWGGGDGTVFRYPPRSLETENYLIESLRIAVKVVNVDVSEIVQ